MPDYTVNVIEDAIRLLDHLQSGEGQSLAQLQKASGLVKNKVFRLLFTLEKHGLVQRNEAGQYVLGMKLLEYGQHVQKHMTVITASQTVMDELLSATSETIFLGVISDDDALCVAARESKRSIRLYGEVGRRAPLLYGGIPKILLAYLPPAERDRALSKSQVLDAAQRSALEATLARIREQGYCIVIDELDIGSHSIAAPIRDDRGQVIAAMSIAGPSGRFTPDCIPEYVALIKAATRQVSQNLGFPRQA